MRDIVQTIEESVHQLDPIPMPHYSDDVLSTSVERSFKERSVTITYFAPDTEVFQEKLEIMLSLSNKKIYNIDSLVDIPVTLNIRIVPESPISWSITYIYPRQITDYLNDGTDEFGIVTDGMVYSAHGISSYTLDLDLAVERFAENGVFSVLRCSPVSFSRRVSSYREIVDFTDPFFVLPINTNTLSLTRSIEEGVEQRKLFNYTWTGSMLSK